MLIKSADDKSKRLRLLEELRHAPVLDTRQRDWLSDEHKRVKGGIEGERDAAYYIDTYFHDGENHVVLHDLRLVDDGQVAQIDHLIMGRGFIVYLIETKAFNGNLIINEQGEFTVEYGDRRYGIESPLEQSKRHEAVLLRVMERLGITGRTQSKPMIKHVVLLHPKGVITRPDGKRFDSSNVIKADQFGTWHEKYVDKELGLGKVLSAAFNMRSLETIAEWGRMLKREHRPRDLLELPDFMRPKASPPQDKARSKPAPEPAPRSHEVQPPDGSARSMAVQTDGHSTASEKRLICATCGSKISYQEGKFCWNHPNRFQGRQYCRAHQAAFT